MNSAPNKRYRTASEPMTPTSEIALEIGCVCTTTLMAQTTAIIAKIRKRMTSISDGHLGKPGDQKTGHQQIQNRDREEKLPGEAHQLVVTEPRQRAANPHERKENRARLSGEPEQRNQPALHHGQQEDPRDDQENDSEDRQGLLVAPALGVDPMIQRHHTRKREDQSRHQARAILLRPRRHPTAQKQQRRHATDRDHVGVLGLVWDLASAASPIATSVTRSSMAT